jgi:transcriptional regulator with XRE-family HTH domain
MRLTVSSCTRREGFAQPGNACIINLVEIKMGPGRPDPEVQAGRALRRMRLSRDWSQEEAARRMQAYGYDFHQTTIAKIEAAQRPLRVRELADFAALYGVEIQDLIYPPSGSLEDVAREITGLELQRASAESRVASNAHLVQERRAALAAVTHDLEASKRDLAILEERITFLLQESRKLAQPEAGEESARSSFAFSSAVGLSNVGTVEEFVEALRGFRAWSGYPTFQAMADRAGGGVSRNAMESALQDGILPGLDAVIDVVEGCGGNEEDVEAFVAAWHRVAPRGSPLKKPS